MKLYEINQKLQEALYAQECDIDANDDQWLDIISAINLDRNEKIDNICSLLKSLSAEEYAIKAEVSKLSDRSNSLIKKHVSLKLYLQSQLMVNETFKSSKNVIAWRSSVSVNVIDDAKIPDNFLTTKTVSSPNKIAISAAIKNGEIVDGCALVKNKIMVIK